MAITEITPSSITLDTLFVVGGTEGTAINTSNTMEIPYPKQGKLMIIIISSNSNTSPIFTAGFGVSAGKGSLTMTAITSGALNGYIFSSDRLAVATGDGASAIRGCLQITWAASSAGYLKAYYLP
jgi:hypothetical protein